MGVRAIAETVHDEPVVTRLLQDVAADPHQRDESPARPQPKPPTREDMIELMATVARVLGFRFQLLLAFLGAIGLGTYAAVHGGWSALTVFAIYDVIVFLPILGAAMKRG